MHVIRLPAADSDSCGQRQERNGCCQLGYFGRALWKRGRMHGIILSRYADSMHLFCNLSGALDW